MADFIDANAKFEEMDGNRTAVIDRGILCAELTIPYLLREDNASDQDDLAREYVQGFGAKLVNHLVGKFVLSILPPHQAFYRFVATEEAMNAIAQDNKEQRQEIERILALKEEGVLRHINKTGFRTALYPAVRRSMVTGDSLIEIKKDDKYKVFGLNSYVLERDASGNIILLIIKESMSPDALPEEVNFDTEDDTTEVNLFTVVQLGEDGKYTLHQEIGTEVVGEEETFENFDERFISIRWNVVDGEDYGRSYVEEYLGTFIALNKQLKVLNESAVVSAKVVHTVNPNGLTRYKDFVNATNGKVIVGQEQDIGTVRVQKNADMQYTYNLINDYKKELAEAFLMTSASIRDAERVTAQEVRIVASELEGAFGGVYTSIAQDIQLPVIKNAMSKLQIDGGEDVDVIIVAGVEALGRNIELQNINLMMSELGGLASLVGQEEVKQIVDSISIANAIVANTGVAGKNFIKTNEQVSTDVANQKQEAIAQSAIEKGIDNAGQI